MQVNKWARGIKGCCVLLVVVLLLSGCWDRIEIEDRAIVLGIAIDKASPKAQKQESDVTHTGKAFVAPSKGLIRLTAQIAVPGRLPLGPGGVSGGGGGKSQKPIWVVSVVGHTIDDALMNLQQQLADKIFLGHLRVIVVSQAIAKKGLKQISDFMRRDSEVRRTTWLLVTKKDAARVMDVAPPLERIPTLYLTSTMTEAIDMGKLPKSFLGVFWRTTSSKGTNAFLPYIIVRGKDNIEISGLACFKNNRMVGVINPLQIGLYMGIVGSSTAGYAGFVPLHGSKSEVLLQSLLRQSKISVKIDHGRPHATVKVHLEVILKEQSNPNMTIDRTRTLNKIEKINSRQLDEAYTYLIQKTQRMGSDIFGFGEYVRAKHPRYWDKHIRTKDKWERMYKDMAVEVHTTVRIRRVGVKAK